MLSRLRRLRKLEERKITISKTASYMIELDSQFLKSGDVIGISARTVNWQPWFQVYLDYNDGSSSFYDGPDAEKAFDVYKELLIAFKGVHVAEQFAKLIPVKMKQIDKYIQDPRKRDSNQYYHNLTYKAPGFLGFPN